MVKLQTIAYVAIITLFRAEASAVDGSLRILEKRAAYYGGFSLSLNLASYCPAGTYSCAYSAEGPQGGPCCPLHTVCTSSADFCCPTSADCSDAVTNSPTCADPSWTLLSNGDVDFLCCPSGMVADGTGECVSPGGTGESSQATYYTSETQANNASPTGDGVATGLATATATGPAGAAATSSTPTVAGGSSPTSAGTTASTTKKSSADKTFAAGGAVACVMALVHLLL